MNDEPMSAEKPPYFSAPHLELVCNYYYFFSLCFSIFLPSYFTIMTHLIIQKSFESQSQMSIFNTECLNLKIKVDLWTFLIL